MKRIFLISLFFLLANTIVLSQDNLSVIAKIGNENLTAKDFKLRFELSPYIPTNKKVNRHSDLELKKDFLYSLLAEILWAKEADRLGLGSSERFKLYFQPLEDLFVRDGLFKIEVKDKVKLTASEVTDAIEKSQYKLITKIFSSSDSVVIHSLSHQLKSASNVDSLLSAFAGIDTASSEIHFASLKDQKIEDALYKLKLFEITPPIKTEIGWVVFRLENKIFTPIDLNDESAVNKAKDALRDRKIEKRYLEYMAQLLKGTSITIDTVSFNSTYKIIWSTLRNKPLSKDYTDYFPLEEKDFQNILNLTEADILNKSLFLINRKSFSVKDFVADLSFHGFSVTKLDSIIILNQLAQRAKLYVEEQLLTSEGYAKQVNLLPEVRKDISLWKQKYLAEFYFKTNLDSMNVTESEIYNIYNSELTSNKNIPLMNVRLVTLKELDVVSEIFDQLQNGESFADITKRFGKTDPLVNELGETGLKPSMLLGDIGQVAAQLKLNEIYGPIRRDNSYSILQVFERTDTTGQTIPAYDSIKYELRNKIRVNRTIEQLTKSTFQLAEKYGVKIFNDALDKMTVSKIPLFMHRFMGFGGRIAGMPLLTPFSEWAENEDFKKLLP
ncbi:MAG: hypothetical protein HXY50_05435 [Ignavibacteriaceae bacterium]|nr:hypothetical protein [Ignavibacteriaceae bacterium]